MSGEYSLWRAAKDVKVAEGDVAEYLAWYMEHPSPLQRPLVDREWTRKELAAKAIVSAAHSFKGTKVEVRFSDMPGWAQVVEGVLGGIGQVLMGGNAHHEAVVVQAEHQLVMIPVRNILDMENAR